jgi:hypothetical protein
MGDGFVIDVIKKWKGEIPPIMSGIYAISVWRKKMYSGYSEWDEFIAVILLIFILLSIWGI